MDLFYQASFVVFWPMAHAFKLKCIGNQNAALKYLKSMSKASLTSLSPEDSAEYHRKLDVFFSRSSFLSETIYYIRDVLSLCKKADHVRTSLRAIGSSSKDLSDSLIEDLRNLMHRFQMKNSQYHEDFLAPLPSACDKSSTMKGVVKYISMLLDQLDLDASRRGALIKIVFDRLSSQSRKHPIDPSLGTRIMDFLAKHDRDLSHQNLFIDASFGDPMTSINKQSWMSDLLISWDSRPSRTKLPTASPYRQLLLRKIDRMSKHVQTSRLSHASFWKYLRFLITYEDEFLSADEASASASATCSSVADFLQACKEQLLLYNDNIRILDFIRNLRSSHLEYKYASELRELALHWIFSSSSKVRMLQSMAWSSQAIAYFSADYFSSEEQDRHLQRIQDEYKFSHHRWDSVWELRYAFDKTVSSEYREKLFDIFYRLKKSAEAAAAAAEDEDVADTYH
jgi:hypothetical protein